MGIDIVTLALARKYVNETANALGAVKGAPCTIKAVEETDIGNIITFGWVGADGSEQTTQITVRHGTGEVDVNEALERIDAGLAAAEEAADNANAAADRATRAVTVTVFE